MTAAQEKKAANVVELIDRAIEEGKRYALSLDADPENVAILIEIGKNIQALKALKLLLVA